MPVPWGSVVTKHRAGPEGGFTLLEVIAAVAILSLVVVAWLAAMGSELRVLARAEGLATATALAEDRLAAVALLGRDALPILPDSLRGGEFGEPFRGYRWETETRSLPGKDLVEVTVAVSGPAGRQALTTVFPSPGIVVRRR